MDYENKKINGIHATRYVASYLNAGGRITGIPRHDQKFFDWLKQLIVNGRALTMEEINDIYYVAQMMHSGKLELEQSAKLFLKVGA